jgi:hypothetical protein
MFEFRSDFAGKIQIDEGQTNVKEGRLVLKVTLGEPRQPLAAADRDQIDYYVRGLMGEVHTTLDYYRRNPNVPEFVLDASGATTDQLLPKHTHEMKLVPHELSDRASISDFAREIRMKSEIAKGLGTALGNAGVVGHVTMRPSPAYRGCVPSCELVQVWIHKMPERAAK